MSAFGHGSRDLEKKMLEGLIFVCFKYSWHFKCLLCWAWWT